VTVRDPIHNPLPGDVLEAEATRDQCHVHKVSDGEVYCGKWTADGRSLGLVRATLERWTHECTVCGAKVIQMAEDAPEWIREDL
jgi:hypothetical protein